MKNFNISTFIALLLGGFILFFARCNKETSVSVSKNVSLNSSDTVKFVLTPFGKMLKSNVHLIETGYHLNMQHGHLTKIYDKTGKVEKDFGKIDIITNNTFNRQPNKKVSPVTTPIVPSFNFGTNQWTTYAGWTNASGTPINYFSTNWIVPDPPTTNDSQIIYLFNGMQNASPSSSATDIMQPVLQWGFNNAFGGNYWLISNWYVTSINGTVQNFATTPIQVNPGTSLQGIISLTGQSQGYYDYSSSFTGYSNTLQINNYNTPQQYYACETLETYGIVQLADYPPDLNVKMKNIILLSGGRPAPLIWSKSVLDNTGQTTLIISNNSDGNGEVDITFGQPSINGYPSFGWSSPGSAGGTINALPGSYVRITIRALGPSPGAYNVTFSLLNGIKFIDGSISFSVENGSSSRIFLMPSNGSINWAGDFSQIYNSGWGTISLNPVQ